ncbi:hypothetical protein [Asanoa siamensis]|uniref:Uncharacterized protein n=1 Tax=Asanoa siamensis TaxID=926357 RepID=A0ABQ4CS75_9ACTN|nr:hypothetical protein [Asanoa siamensis]GIF74106.1 hypothetical protein Asi02nite_36240 [Asanoa siamensis]
MPERIRSTMPAAGSPVSPIVRGDAPLDVAETTFRLLTAGPEPLSIDGAEIGHGLPARRIPLHELAAILMHPSCSYRASDTVWRLLIERARTSGPAWVVGAAGVALPGLRAAARRLSRVHSGDVQAEVLTGFLAALRQVRPAGPRVVQRLCSAALVTARAALRASEPRRADVTGNAPGSAPPPAPSGHPDFVLACAVTAGVITAAEADLIGATRLEDTSVAEYAHRHGKTYWAVSKARARAEERLVAAIQSGALTDTDTAVISEATTTPGADQPQRV